MKGAQAAVAPVDLHVDQSGGHRIHGRTTVAFDPAADDAERGHFLDQRKGELGPLPIVVDHRQDLGVDEGAGAGQVVLLPRGERLTQPELVGAQRLTDGQLQIRARMQVHV